MLHTFRRSLIERDFLHRTQRRRHLRQQAKLLFVERALGLHRKYIITAATSALRGARCQSAPCSTTCTRNATTACTRCSIMQAVFRWSVHDNRAGPNNVDKTTQDKPRRVRCGPSAQGTRRTHHILREARRLRRGARIWDGQGLPLAKKVEQRRAPQKHCPYSDIAANLKWIDPLSPLLRQGSAIFSTTAHVKHCASARGRADLLLVLAARIGGRHEDDPRRVAFHVVLPAGAWLRVAVRRVGGRPCYSPPPTCCVLAVCDSDEQLLTNSFAGLFKGNQTPTKVGAGISLLERSLLSTRARLVGHPELPDIARRACAGWAAQLKCVRQL